MDKSWNKTLYSIYNMFSMSISWKRLNPGTFCARGAEGATRQSRGGLFKLRFYIFGIIAVIPPGNPFLFLFRHHSHHPGNKF